MITFLKCQRNVEWSNLRFLPKPSPLTIQVGNMREPDYHPSFLDQFLLQLASSVQSLRIHQQHTDEIDDQNLFWGIRNFDWTSVIIEMYSKKLDKLRIETIYRLPDDIIENIKMVSINFEIWFYILLFRNCRN